jgi:hypothetical protein
MNPTTIDLTPTWVDAVGIYIAVLRNPEAPHEAIDAATSELLRLAAVADAHRNRNRQPHP